MDHRCNYHGEVHPPSFQLGPISYWSPNFRQNKSQKCSIVDFVAYAVMKVVHELHQCTYIIKSSFLKQQSLLTLKILCNEGPQISSLAFRLYKIRFWPGLCPGPGLREQNFVW